MRDAGAQTIEMTAETIQLLGLLSETLLPVADAAVGLSAMSRKDSDVKAVWINPDRAVRKRRRADYYAIRRG